MREAVARTIYDNVSGLPARILLYEGHWILVLVWTVVGVFLIYSTLGVERNDYDRQDEYRYEGS